MKRLISALLAIFTVATLICVPVVADGVAEPEFITLTQDQLDADHWGIAAGKDGTSEATAYEIATVTDLAILCYNVNKGTSRYDGMYFKQTANIDLGGKKWVPIGCGSAGNSFNGTYDGNGFAITGFYLTEVTKDTTDSNLFNDFTPAGDKYGFFGCMRSSTTATPTVKNLSLYGTIISERVVDDARFAAYGGKALQEPSIKNATDVPAVEGVDYSDGISAEEATKLGTTATTMKDNYIGAKAVGSIVGVVLNGDNATDVLLSNLFVDVDLYPYTSLVFKYNADGYHWKDASTTKAGGLIGEAREGVVIDGCIFAGSVNCVTPWSRNPVNVGGFIGYGYGTANGEITIKNSYMTGSVNAVTLTNNNACRIGGLVGYAKAGINIDGCYMLGSVNVGNRKGSFSNVRAGYVAGYIDTASTFASGNGKNNITNTVCAIPVSTTMLQLNNGADWVPYGVIADGAKMVVAAYDANVNFATAASTSIAAASKMSGFGDQYIKEITVDAAAAATPTITMRALQDKKVGNTVSVRFLSTVDSLTDIDSIGYNVKAIKKDGTASAATPVTLDTVYKTITADGLEKYTGEGLGGAENSYIAGLVINGIPTDGLYAVWVQPYTVSGSTTTYGETTVVFYNNGEFVGYFADAMGELE